MHATTRFFLATVLCSALAAPALAAPPKIAVVDLQKVLLSTRAGRAAKAKFEGLQKKKKKALKRRDNQLKAEEKKLVRERMELEKELAKHGVKGVTPLLKAKAQAFQAKLKLFQQQVLDFQKTQRETLQQLAKKESELLRPIEQKIKKHIDKIAKERGFTIVLNRVAVVFHVPSVDITAEVTRRMGK